MREKILAFLKKNQVMVLATVDSQKHPHCSPLLYVADDDLNIYFFTHDDSRKAVHLSENEYVAVSVWSHDEFSLQIEGSASVVSDVDTITEKIGFLADAAAKESTKFSPPILRLSSEMNYVVFKIKVSTVRFIDLANPHIKEYKSAIQVLNL